MKEANLSKDRLKVLNKISEYEALKGEYFNLDVEDDPPSKMLYPDDVDYLDKKLKNKIPHLIARAISKALRKKTVKHNLIEVKGIENLKEIKTGAIITSNHFAPFESACVSEVVKRINPKSKLYIVIKEGNYQMKGLYGFLFRHADTIPISSNIHTMKKFHEACKEVLNRGNFILIYPEQSMWWNYRKPRPQKNGAAYFAIKYDVPIIPCFVTMEDLNTFEKDGSKTQKYTIHIMKPLYKDPALTQRDNAQLMTKLNYEMCVKKYEEVYKIKLSYGDINEEDL